MTDLKSSSDFAAIYLGKKKKKKQKPRTILEEKTTPQQPAKFTVHLTPMLPCQTDAVSTDPIGSLSTATTRRNLRHKHLDKGKLSN